MAFKQPHYYESILKEAAFHLSQLLKPLIKDFDEYVPIFAYGGIFDQYLTLVDDINHLINPYTISHYNQKAQLGGLVIARDLWR